MNIAKIFASLALVAVPCHTVAAQSATEPDSGTQGSRAGKWIASTGAVTGAALFLVFTQGHATSAPPAAVGPHYPGPTPATPSAPTAGVAPSDPSTPADQPSAPPAGNTTVTESGVAPPSNQAPLVEPGAPTETGDDSYTPANDEPPLFKDDPPPPNLGVNPQAEAPAFVPVSSTVPEPGALALTATGVIGLLPLVRRRRK